MQGFHLLWVVLTDGLSQFNAEVDEASDLSFATFPSNLDFGTFFADEIFPTGAIKNILIHRFGLIDGYFP